MLDPDKRLLPDKLPVDVAVVLELCKEPQGNYTLSNDVISSFCTQHALRTGPKKSLTAEELDADLDSYTNKVRLLYFNQINPLTIL